MIIDGKVWFDGMRLDQFYGSPSSVWTKVYRRNGHTVKPDLTNVSADNPTVAHISHNKLLALCPNCNSAEYVWRDGPHVMICAECGNADINGMARRVDTPDATLMAAIELVLSARSRPQNRNWDPSESVQDLLQENLEHGVMVDGLEHPTN